MLINSSLPDFLGVEDLKTAANILNKVSSKFVYKTLYEHKTKNEFEIIFYFYNIFQMALDIIQNDEYPKPQNVEECRKRNYWLKWTRAVHTESQLLKK